ARDTYVLTTRRGPISLSGPRPCAKSASPPPHCTPGAMIAGRGLEAEIIGCPRDVAAGAGATTAIAAEGSREALTSTQEGRNGYRGPCTARCVDGVPRNRGPLPHPRNRSLPRRAGGGWIAPERRRPGHRPRHRRRVRSG